MIVTARFAFGNARLRAMKSRLLGPEDGPALRAAPSLAALAGALGAAPPAGLRPFRLELFGSLVRDYAKVIASYPRGGGLFRALIGLHEIENLKLAWRAHGRGLAPGGWAPFWRPLGALAVLDLESFRHASSVREAAALARGTPYERAVAEALIAQDKDPAVAELTLDRFATRRLAEEVRRLPRRESVARDLALSVVREREEDAASRRELSGRPDAPRAGKVSRQGLGALRRLRRQACRAAFLGPPLTLAAPVAYLLLREEEVRAVAALAQACGGEPPAPALERVFAASALAG
jgi:ATP synthase C subunit